jgi:iron(III) transport system permease protein
MTPALLAAGIYAFLGNMEDFDTPLLLGLDAQVYILPTLIYFAAYVSPLTNWGLASAYTTLFLFFMVVLIAFYYIAVVRRSKRFATVTGKGFRPRRLKLGRWKWVAVAGVALFFFLSIVLPLAMLVYASLIPAYLGPTWDSISTMSLDAYREVFSDPAIIDAAINTLVIALGAATLTMVIAFFVSFVVIRTQARGRLLFDAMAFAPNAIPAVALAFGIIMFYLHPSVRWIPVYGTVVVVIIAMSTKYLAYASRLGNSSMLQISGELEEAAWVSGVNRLRAFAAVTMPLLLPAFLAGWLWVASHAVRNLTFPLLLGGAGTNETIALRMYIYWERQNNFPLTAAMGICLIAVLVVLALLSRKVIARGFTES